MLKKHRHNAAQGFSLIELLVALVIIAIVIGVARVHWQPAHTGNASLDTRLRSQLKRLAQTAFYEQRLLRCQVFTRHISCQMWVHAPKQPPHWRDLKNKSYRSALQLDTSLRYHLDSSPEDYKGAPFSNHAIYFLPDATSIPFVLTVLKKGNEFLRIPSKHSELQASPPEADL